MRIMKTPKKTDWFEFGIYFFFGAIVGTMAGIYIWGELCRFTVSSSYYSYFSPSLTGLCLALGGAIIGGLIAGGLTIDK